MTQVPPLLQHTDAMQALAELLKTFGEPQFNAFITDPPYGMDYQSNRRTKRMKKIANDTRPFIWWLYYAYELTTDPGCIAVFTDWKNAETWFDAIQVAGYKVRSQIVWDRDSHGMGDLKSGFAPQHDLIWFATKGAWTFPGPRPASVFRSPKVDNSSIVHPNQKPASLMEWLVRHITKPEDWICDPFAGSGSTLQAVAKVGDRHAVGYEIDKEYYLQAKADLDAALSQPSLF